MTPSTMRLAALRAELAAARAERPGPLATNDHAAYIRALARAAERAAAEVAAR